MKKIYLAVLTCTLSILGMETDVTTREDLLKMQVLAGFTPSTYDYTAEKGAESEPVLGDTQDRLIVQLHEAAQRRAIAEHTTQDQQEDRARDARINNIRAWAFGGTAILVSSLINNYLENNCPNTSLTLCSLSPYLSPELNAAIICSSLVYIVRKSYIAQKLNPSMNED